MLYHLSPNLFRLLTTVRLKRRQGRQRPSFLREDMNTWFMAVFNRRNWHPHLHRNQNQEVFVEYLTVIMQINLTKLRSDIFAYQSFVYQVYTVALLKVMFRAFSHNCYFKFEITFQNWINRGFQWYKPVNISVFLGEKQLISYCRKKLEVIKNNERGRFHAFFSSGIWET